jgi:glycosyltransferase involved in cell wall biosynthesis
MNLWLLTNTPSPYQVEFFRAIHSSGQIRLDVRFMRAAHRGERPLDGIDAGFPYRELGGVGRESWRDEFRLHPRALREVLSRDHDFFLLSGHYTSVTFILCALLLRLRRRPWALWLERPWPDDYRPEWSHRPSARSGLVRMLRRGVLSALLRMAPGVFCIGMRALDAYRALGADYRKLFLLPYFCDVTRFATVPTEAAAAVRARFGLSGKTVFLFSGQLAERKAPDLVLAAFGLIARDHPDTALLFLGDGPLRSSLEKSIPEPARGRVHFAGMIPQSELPAFFAASDVFVFPSRHDGWGVVVNEACGAGLPIIAGEGVGAAADLVDGNGFILPRDNLVRLAEKMAFLAERPDERQRLGKRSREIAGRFTPDRGVEMLRHHIQAVMSAQ